MTGPSGPWTSTSIQRPASANSSGPTSLLTRQRRLAGEDGDARMTLAASLRGADVPLVQPALGEDLAELVVGRPDLLERDDIGVLRREPLQPTSTGRGANTVDVG